MTTLQQVAAKVKELHDMLSPHLVAAPASASASAPSLDPPPKPHCRWCAEREIKPEVLKLREWEVSAEQLTPEWFAARKDRITASEIPDILCRGRTSRIERLRKKCGLSDKEMSAFGKAACEHGRKHEDGAIQRFEQATGHRVLPFGLLVNPERPWIGASPDGITYCGISIEAKCPFNRSIRPGEVPAHYIDQVQTQLFVSELKQAAFVQWGVMDDSFDVAWVQPDEDWWMDNVGKLMAFYEQMKEVRADKSKIAKYERRTNNSKKSSPPPASNNYQEKQFNFIL